MMPTDLLDYCERQAQLTENLRFITVTIPSRRRRGERVNVIPGLLGRVLGDADGRMICSIAVADVRRWIEKHLTEIEAFAVMCAERGDHEEADRWFAQYRELRDRTTAPGMWRSRV